MNMDRTADNELKKTYGYRKFIFRLPRDRAVLEQLLRIRYLAFRNVEGQVLVPYCESGIDLDQFDFNAHHLGLFGVDSDIGEFPAGYIRLITTGTGPQVDQLLDTIRVNTTLTSRAFRERDTVFPAIKEFPELKTHIVQSGYGIDTFAEPSRLSIASEINSKKLITSFAIAILAYGIYIGKNHGILTSKIHHARLYKLLGFRDCSVSGARFIHNYGWSSLCMIRSGLQTNPFLRPLVNQYIEQLQESGAIEINLEAPLQLRKARVLSGIESNRFVETGVNYEC